MSYIPGYQFCGPGTRLAKRLARGDAGINPLDATCRDHDIAYSHSNDLTDRHAADNILAEKARKRITASDSALGERAAAAAVWAAMKAKTKIGMGMKPKKKTTKKKATKKRILPTAKRGGALSVQIRTQTVSQAVQTWTGCSCKKKNVKETIKMSSDATKGWAIYWYV